MMTLSKDEARQYIKGQLLDFLSAEFGIKIKGNEKIHCLNPAHADNDASMSHDKRRNKLHCFSCGADYDTLDLIGIAHNLTDPAETFKKAYEIYGIETDSAYRKDFAPQKAKPVNAPDPATQDYINECHKRVNQTDYFTKRALTPEIIDRFKLGYDPTFSTFENDEQGKFKGMTNWQAVIIPNGGTYNARNTDPNADKHNRYRKPKGKPAEIFNLAALDEKQIVYIAEGELDALSIITAGAQAVGLASTSGVNDLLKHLESYKPKAHLVLVPDNDERGEEARAKLEEGLQRLSIPYSVDLLSGEHKDCNEALVKDRDFFLQAIKDSLRDIQAEISLNEEAEKREYLSSIDELELEEADFLISGILERDSLVGVFGESGAGKTFFVLDALSSVATGIDFHGRPVQQAPCIYVCAEGKRGIVKRNRAWNLGRWKNPDGIKAFYPVRCNITLPDDEAEQKLISLIDGTIQKHKITNPGIIAFDTVARTLVGDENSNADMSAYIRAMDRIKARYPGVAVLLVHHTGHTEKNRARGASSLKCALDAEIQVAISADTATGKKTMTVSNTKMKDAEEFPDIYFEMKAVEVFHDKDGEPQSSLYLEEIEGATDSRGRDKKTKLSPVEQVGIDSYLEALEDSIKAKIESGDLTSTSEGVHIEQWRPFYYKRSPADKTKTKIEYFNRARNSLITKQRLTVENDYYRLAGEEHNRTASGYFLTLNKESKSTSPHHTTVSPHVDLDIPQVHTTPHTPLGVWSVDMSPTPKTVVDLSPRGTETPPAEYDEVQAQRWLETAPEEVQEAYRQRVKLYSQSPTMAKSGQALRKTWEQFHRQEVA